MYSFLALFTLAVIPSMCKECKVKSSCYCFKWKAFHLQPLPKQQQEVLSHEGLHENKCKVVSQDQYIEVGSDTKIVCQTSCVHGKVFWTLDNGYIKESTSNSSHSALSLRNFTKRSATLQCHSADTQEVLGGAIIRTYTKPSKISCLLHYDDQATQGLPDLFTCSWEHQTDASLEVNYTVLCDSCARQSEICNSQKTTCTHNYHDISDKIPLVQSSRVTVRAKSAAWEASSDPYEFSPFSILKITRPHISVLAASDHLLVEWSLPPFFQRKQRCQVKYSKAVDEGGPEWVLNKTLETNVGKGEMVIEKVESCHNYTFAVRCALGEAPWSDWSHERTVLTKLNKRDVELRLWRKVAEADKNGVRKVHAMWTGIPSTCQDTFTYMIEQTPYKEDMTGVNHTDTSCANSVCDVKVNQGARRINLKIFHDDWMMEDSVYVPAVGESLPQVTNIQTSTLEGVILVSWSAPAQPVSGYMVDYTHNGNEYFWKQTKYTNATLFDLLDKKPYNITVTPLFDDKTGHGAQTLHICSGVGDPGNVSITEIKTTDKSVLVKWDVESQEACSGDVVNYTIFYGTQKGPQLNVTVDSTARDILLKDLNPDTQYRVVVEATALTGTTKSTEEFFHTKRFDPRLSAALGVSGGILIVLVLSLGLCCAVQWRKFKEKPVPDPGHSSVALWSPMSHEKGICPFPPFHNPAESFCDSIYTEAPRTSTSPPAAGSHDNPASDQNMTGEYADPATVPAPHIQSEEPAEPVDKQHASFPAETTELLSSEDSPSSPYRSQSPEETPALRTSKQCARAPVKQQEKTPPLTVYVTLDMFEQGQGR